MFTTIAQKVKKINARECTCCHKSYLSLNGSHFKGSRSEFLAHFEKIVIPQPLDTMKINLAKWDTFHPRKYKKGDTVTTWQKVAKDSLWVIVGEIEPKNNPALAHN